MVLEPFLDSELSFLDNERLIEFIALGEDVLIEQRVFLLEQIGDFLGRVPRNSLKVRK